MRDDSASDRIFLNNYQRRFYYVADIEGSGPEIFQRRGGYV